MDVSKWKSLALPAGVAAAILVGMIFVGQIGGCAQVQDTIAKVIGAPTNAEKRQAFDALDAAEVESAKAHAQIADLRKSIEAASSTKIEAEAREAAIRAAYTEAAVRLPSLTGTAADALIGMMNQMMAQISTAKDDADAAGRMIAGFSARVAEFAGAADQAARTIEAKRLELEGMESKTAKAISGVVGTVKVAGELANLAIPGASAGAHTVGNILGGVLSLILGGTTILSLRKAKEEKEKKEVEEKKADSLTKVVQMTEKMGLIRDDPEAVKAKAIARVELGPEVMSVLHTATAHVPAA